MAFKLAARMAPTYLYNNYLLDIFLLFIKEETKMFIA